MFLSVTDGKRKWAVSKASFSATQEGPGPHLPGLLMLQPASACLIKLRSCRAQSSTETCYLLGGLGTGQGLEATEHPCLGGGRRERTEEGWRGAGRGTCRKKIEGKKHNRVGVGVGLPCICASEHDAFKEASFNRPLLVTEL